MKKYIYGLTLGVAAAVIWAKYVRRDVDKTQTQVICAAGWNGFGQLATGTSEYQQGWVASTIDADELMDVAAGGSSFHGFSLFVDRAGHLYHCGFGLGRDAHPSVRPSPVACRLRVVSVSAGTKHAALLTAEACCWTWGDNSFHQLGALPAQAARASRAEPARVLSGVSAVSCGDVHTMFVCSERLFACGSNSLLQLGFAEDVDCVRVPELVPSFANKDVKLISAGESHSLVLVGDTVWAFGCNANGQLGEPTVVDISAPIGVLSGSFQQIVAAADHSLALSSSGELWAWGASFSATPRIGQLPRVLSVAFGAGSHHSVVLTSEGVYVCGSNAEGQLGLVPSALEATEFTQVDVPFEPSRAVVSATHTVLF